MKRKSDPYDLFSCAGLDRKKIRKLAFETGFCKRNSGKISAPDFVIQLCLESISGTVSYNDLAARVEARTGIAASRQAYWERTDEPCLMFFQSILEHVMLSKCDPHQIRSFKRKGRFKRILLQDSTIIKLPLRLFEVFSGVKNSQRTRNSAAHSSESKTDNDHSQYQKLFLPLLRKLDTKGGKIGSLIKLMRYITRNLDLLPKYLGSSIPPPQICAAVLRYCTYEKRNRPNFMTQMEAILVMTPTP